MTLVRILDDDGSHELQALLKAAPDAPPMPSAVHERLQNYAIGLAAGIATTAAIGAGTAQAAQAGLFGKAITAVIGAPLAVKLTLGAALFVGASTTGYVVSGPVVEKLREAPRSVVHAASVPTVTTVATAPARAVNMPEPVSEVVAPPRAAVARSTTAPSTTAPAVGIADEARMLEVARAALASRPAEALAIADEHAGRFPRGQLGAEREFIAIDALMRLGRQGEAARRAEPRLSQTPDSLYARRLRQLLGREE